MQRTEPGTATLAVALGVALSALGKSLGLPPMPPGLLQPLAPVASVIGREAAGRAARTALITLIAISPAWAWAADAPFDSGFDASAVLEGPTAAMASFVHGVALFLILAVAVAFGLVAVVGAVAGAGRSPHDWWIARACARFKQPEAPREVPWAAKAARPRGAASPSSRAGGARAFPRRSFCARFCRLHST